MSYMNVIDKLLEVIVCEEAGLTVVKSIDGKKLFSSSQDYTFSLFTTTRTIELCEESVASPVLRLVEEQKRLRNEKVVEARNASDSKLIGRAVMKKRFFWTSHEIQDAKGNKIAGFKCDGEKYVFDGGIGTARQDERSKTISFTVRFAAPLDREIKLLMIVSAFLMITIEKEAQEALKSMYH